MYKRKTFIASRIASKSFKINNLITTIKFQKRYSSGVQKWGAYDCDLSIHNFNLHIYSWGTVGKIAYNKEELKYCEYLGIKIINPNIKDYFTSNEYAYFIAKTNVEARKNYRNAAHLKVEDLIQSIYNWVDENNISLTSIKKCA